MGRKHPGTRQASGLDTEIFFLRQHRRAVAANEIAAGGWEGCCPEVDEDSLRRYGGGVAKRTRCDAVTVDSGHGLPLCLAAYRSGAIRLQCGMQGATGRSLHAGAAAIARRLMRVSGMVVRRFQPRCRCMVTLGVLGRTSAHTRKRNMRPGQHSEHERQARAGSSWSSGNHCITLPVILQQRCDARHSRQCATGWKPRVQGGWPW